MTLLLLLRKYTNFVFHHHSNTVIAMYDDIPVEQWIQCLGKAVTTAAAAVAVVCGNERIATTIIIIIIIVLPIRVVHLPIYG